MFNIIYEIIKYLYPVGQGGSTGSVKSGKVSENPTVLQLGVRTAPRRLTTPTVSRALARYPNYTLSRLRVNMRDYDEPSSPSRHHQLHPMTYDLFQFSLTPCIQT